MTSTLAEKKAHLNQCQEVAFQDAEEAKDWKAEARQSLLGGQGDWISISSQFQACPTQQKVGVSAKEQRLY